MEVFIALQILFSCISPQCCSFRLYHSKIFHLFCLGTVTVSVLFWIVEKALSRQSVYVPCTGLQCVWYCWFTAKHKEIDTNSLLRYKEKRWNLSKKTWRQYSCSWGSSWQKHSNLSPIFWGTRSKCLLNLKRLPLVFQYLRNYSTSQYSFAAKICFNLSVILYPAWLLEQNKARFYWRKNWMISCWNLKRNVWQ